MSFLDDIGGAISGVVDDTLGYVVEGADIVINEVGELFNPGADAASVTQDILNRLTAASIIEVRNECLLSTQGTQAILFSCQPILNQTWYEENSSCLQCLNNITDFWTNQLEVVQPSVWNSRPPEVRLGFDEQFDTIIEQQRNCRGVCKACNFLNNSQASTFSVDQNCEFTQDNVVDIQSQILGAFMVTLNSREDFLSGLSRAVGAESSADLVNLLRQRIRQVFSSNQLNAMISGVFANQTMIFRNFDGSSTTASGNSQESTYTAIYQYLSDNSTSTQLLSTAEWESFNTAIQDTTTIDDLGAAVFVTANTFGETLNSSLGIALVVVLIFAAFIFILLVTLTLKNIISL